MKKTDGKISIQTVNVKGHQYTRYVVDFGTLDGKRQRKTFKTQFEAKAHINRNAILQKKIGRMAGKLTDTDLRDAAKAIDRLQRLVSLETAAMFYMTHNHPEGGKVTTAEAIEKFLQSRGEKNLRAVTIGDYKAKLTPFARDMNGKPLCQITVAILEDWLRAGNYTASTRKSYLRATAAFFQWAVKRRYMIENPARSIDSPREDRNAVTYLTVKDAEKLLQVASKEWPALVPYLAIGMFAGLRPSEIHGHKTDHPPLDWRKIDFERKIITIDAEQTKTRDGRRVEMSDNLVRWLFSHRREHGPIYFTRSSLASVVTKAKIDFPKDVLRHTAGTYAYAQKKHEGEVAIMLGDTIKTIKKHYVNPMVDKADAEKFWALEPKTEAEIIPIPRKATAAT
jgi:site-specific recombinase XerD